MPDLDYSSFFNTEWKSCHIKANPNVIYFALHYYACTTLMESYVLNRHALDRLVILQRLDEVFERVARNSFWKTSSNSISASNTLKGALTCWACLPVHWFEWRGSLSRVPTAALSRAFPFPISVSPWTLLGLCSLSSHSVSFYSQVSWTF